MKPPKRSVRRHHRERMLERAYNSSRLQWERDPETRRYVAVRWYNHLKKCSCWMCGNPRRHQRRVTVQERRQLQSQPDEEYTP